MKRLMVFMLLLALVSCGSGGTKNAPQMDGEGTWSTESMPEEADTQSSAVVETNKKIIRNVSADLEVDDAKISYGQILDVAEQCGGYEFGLEQMRRNEYNIINATLKIPAQRLDEFNSYLQAVDKVINFRVSADDVTEAYTDVEIRLRSMRSSLETYYKLLADAENIDELLKVQNAIDELTSQIERSEGQLALWNDRIALSTVELTIREKDDPVKASKDVNWNTLSFMDMLEVAANGFSNMVMFVVAIVQWLLITIISVLPLAVVCGGVFWVVRRVKRSRNTDTKREPAENKKNNEN